MGKITYNGKDYNVFFPIGGLEEVETIYRNTGGNATDTITFSKDYKLVVAFASGADGNPSTDKSGMGGLTYLENNISLLTQSQNSYNVKASIAYKFDCKAGESITVFHRVGPAIVYGFN